MMCLALLLVVNVNEGTHASPQLHILHDYDLGCHGLLTVLKHCLPIIIYTSWYTVETIQTTLVQDIVLLLYDMAIPKVNRSTQKIPPTTHTPTKHTG